MSNLKEIKAQRIAEGKERKAKREEASELAKYENEAYIDTLVAQQARAENVAKLEDIAQSLNSIETIKVPVIGKVSVNCFAPTNLFGAEIGLLLGIAGTLKFLFVEEQIEQAYALTGTNPVMVEDLGIALGDTAYFNKNTGEFRTAIDGNFKEASVLLEDFAKDLGVTADMSKFTETRYNKWFKTKDTSADTKHKAHLKMLAINNNSNFRIDDEDEDDTQID